jgi:histone H3/H4
MKIRATRVDETIIRLSRSSKITHERENMEGNEKENRTPVNNNGSVKRRKSSYSGRRSFVRTPVSVRRRLPVTPHALRALGKLATPRRRSLRFGRGMRATPRDELRLLSRVLAKERREKRKKEEEEEREQRKRDAERQKEEEEKQMAEKEQEFAEEQFEDDPNDDGDLLMNNDGRNEDDDYDVVDPIEMDDLDLEVKRRATDRLSLAGDARLSEGFDFGNASMVSGNGRKSDTFQIVMEEEEEEENGNSKLIQEDSFRIEFNDDDNDDQFQILADDDMPDMDFNDDDQTLPLRQLNKTKSRHQKPQNPETAVPRKVIKDLLKNMTESKIPNDTLDAIISASDLYFDQVMGDLAEYSDHAKRKTIDKSDVIQLMRRQRLINQSASPFTLAHRLLPAELLDKITKKS